MSIKEYQLNGKTFYEVYVQISILFVKAFSGQKVNAQTFSACRS
jgi:hypothetical protein